MRMVNVDSTPCIQCGLIPTAVLPIRRHVGMVLVQQFVKLEQPLCRDHGRAVAKAFQRKTLLQGWWGVVSVFVNVFVVVRNTMVLRAYGKLDAPRGLPWANRPGGVLPATPGGDHPPAWHPDPLGGHELRWHDGAAWTARVSDGGVTAFDPLVER
jgi:hypothetical protein